MDESNINEQLINSRENYKQEQKLHNILSKKLKNKEGCNSLPNLKNLNISISQLLFAFNTPFQSFLMILGFILNFIIGVILIGIIMLLGMTVNYYYVQDKKEAIKSRYLLNIDIEYIVPICLFLITFLYFIQKWILTLIDEKKTLVFQSKCFMYLMTKEASFYKNEPKINTITITHDEEKEEFDLEELKDKSVYKKDFSISGISKSIFIDDSFTQNINQNNLDDFNASQLNGINTLKVLNQYKLTSLYDNVSLSNNIKDLSSEVQIASKIGFLCFCISAIISTCVASFLQNWIIGVLIISSTLIVFILLKLLDIYIKEEQNDKKNEEAKLVQIAKEILFNQRELQIYNNLEYHLKRFDSELLEFDSSLRNEIKTSYSNDINTRKDSNKKIIKLSLKKSPIILSILYFIEISTIIFTILYGSYVMQISSFNSVKNENIFYIGQLTSIIIFMMCNYFILTNLFKVKNEIDMVLETQAAEFFFLLSEISRVSQDNKIGLMMRPNKVLMKSSITFNQTSFTERLHTAPNSNPYLNNNLQLLCNDLIFNIEENQRVFITGSNADYFIPQLLLRTVNCTGGEILIDNYKIKDIDIGYLRNIIGVIDPSDMLFENMSIKDNLLLGRDEIVNKILKDSLLDVSQIEINTNNVTDMYLNSSNQLNERKKYDSIDDYITFQCKFTRCWDFISSLEGKLNYVLTKQDIYSQKNSLYMMLIKMTRAIITEPKILIINHPNQFIYNLIENMIGNEESDKQSSFSDSVSNSASQKDSSSNNIKLVTMNTYNINDDLSEVKSELDDKLLIFDEILNSVTSQRTSIFISDDLKYIKKDETPSVAPLCSRIVVINKGRIECDGNYSDLERNEKFKQIALDKLEKSTENRKTLVSTLFQKSMFHQKSQTEKKPEKKDFWDFSIFSNLFPVLNTDSDSLNISNVFLVNEIKPLENYQSESLNETYLPLRSFLNDEILYSSKANVLYYTNMVLNSLSTVCFCIFGYLFSSIIIHELHKSKKDTEEVTLIKELKENLVTYTMMIMLLITILFFTSIKRYLHSKLVIRLTGHIQSLLFKSFNEDNDGEYHFKLRFNKVLNNSSTLNYNKSKNYKLLNKQLLFLFNFTKCIDPYISYRMKTVSNFSFVLFNILFVLYYRDLLGLILIGFYVIIIFFNWVRNKIINYYSENIFQIQKDAFYYALKAMNNYNFLNFYNFNIHARNKYSSFLDKIDLKLFSYTLISSIIKAFVLLIYTFALFSTFYFSNIVYRKTSADVLHKYEIISPLLCFLFGFCGQKLLESSFDNSSFDMGMKGSFILVLNGIYKKIYESRQLEKSKKENKAVDNSFFNQNSLNNSQIENKAILLKDKINEIFDSNLIYFSLICDYFFKNNLNCSQVNNTSRIDLNSPNIHSFQKYSQLPFLNDKNRNSKYEEIFNNLHLIENKNQLRKVYRLRSLKGVIEKTEFIGLCGDSTVHQIFRTIEENINQSNKCVLFTNTFLVHESMTIKENIFSCINPKEFQNLSLELKEKLLKEVAEICGLKELIDGDFKCEDLSYKDFCKINFARNIFLDGDLLLVDDILLPLNPQQENLLTSYFRSDLFKSKRRIVLIASNRSNFLSLCGECILIKQCDVVGRFENYTYMKYGSKFYNSVGS